MAYRKIPKKFDYTEMAGDIKNRLLYSDDIDPTVVYKIAEIMGSSRRTVYAVLDGEIKLSLDFIHAAVIATSGDPEITKYLEPDGFQLSRIDSLCIPDKKTLAEECLDDIPALARFHKVLADPNAKPHEIKMARNNVVYELEQNINKRLEGDDR